MNILVLERWFPIVEVLRLDLCLYIFSSLNFRAQYSALFDMKGIIIRSTFNWFFADAIKLCQVDYSEKIVQFCLGVLRAHQNAVMF